MISAKVFVPGNQNFKICLFENSLGSGDIFELWMIVCLNDGVFVVGWVYPNITTPSSVNNIFNYGKIVMKC